MRFLFLFAFLFAGAVVAGIDHSRITPRLINGSEVNEGEYPEVINIISCFGGKCGTCSASIVGPQTILTAAHCVRGDGGTQFTYNQNIYKAQCEANPAFKENTSHDIALCLIDKTIDLKYAHLSQRKLSKYDDVKLMGFGCTQIDGGGRSNGILRVGTANVKKLPGEVTKESYDKYFQTYSDVALCFGDSGGPAFHYIDNPKTEIHFVAGINSRGNIRRASYITAVYLNEIRDFIKTWADVKKQEICGFNGDCGIPAVPMPPKNSCRVSKSMRAFFKGKLEYWEERYFACMNDAASRVIEGIFE